MARGSPEIFRKIKVITLLSAFLLSSVLLSGFPLLSPTSNNSSSAGTVNPGVNTSYADLSRPTLFQVGKYMNYSVQFSQNPSVLQGSTTLSASLNYAVTSVGGQYYTFNETTSSLHVNYGFGNTNRSMGVYPISTSPATIDLETWRAYSTTSFIKASSQNLTNLNLNYKFSTILNMYKANGSYSSYSGNGTSAMIVDSLLAFTQSNRLNYYAHYRALLSYYKSLNCLYINPKGLYASNFTTAAGLFTYNGTADIKTALGTRSTVLFVNVNATYGWQQFLYFDMYTGILLKGIFNYDKKTGIYAHQLVYDLKSTNVNLGTNSPTVTNEFQAALTDIQTYLAKSALNDSNSTLFNHAAIGGSTTLVNKTKISADIFKVLSGYSEAFGPSLSDIMAQVNASALHDTTNGGFYQSMNPSGIHSSVKTVSDAAWAIIASENFKGMSMFQQEMFNFMTKLYTNGTHSNSKFYAFTRTNASESQFYASDNLIAALALNWLALNTTWAQNKNGVVNATLVLNAQNMSYYVISLFYAPNTTPFPSFWDGSGNKLFVTSIGKSGDINSGDTDKSVLDACMAIVALGEYYLYNQSAVARDGVGRAMDAFNVLLRSPAWNATRKGFDHQLDYNLGLNDANQYLEDNAWAMLASVELLQAANMAYNKQNITYYDVACDTWSCIKSQLHDAQNKTYIHAANNRYTISGDLGILLSALSRMETLANSTSLSGPLMNATGATYIFEDSPTASAAVQWTFFVTRSLQGPLLGRSLTDVNIRIPLNYSDVNFYVRYANGTIYNHLLCVTDNTGRATFQFPLPVPPQFYDQFASGFQLQEAHVISASANRTGFVPAENISFFRIMSSTTVMWNSSNPYVQFNFSNPTSLQTVTMAGATAQIPTVYPGQKFTVTMNFTENEVTKQTVNVTFNSSILQRFSTLQVLNGSSGNKPYTFSLTAGINIPLGVQNVSCTVSKNNSVFFSSLIKFYVETPLLISYINYSRYIVDTGANYLNFKVKNINVNRNESVTVKFSSVNLVLVSGSSSQAIQNIRPLQEVPVSVAFKLASNASRLTMYQFSLELVWNNQSLGISNFQIQYRAPIEIVSITGPSQPTQGVPMYFLISIMNNRQANVQVEIQVTQIMNDNTTSTLASFNRTLTPGLNNILYTYTESIPNPFDVGQREYLVVVRSAGNEVGRGTVLANVQTSIETVIFWYVMVFAIIGAILLLTILKKQQLASIRR
ncbi:MAG TPA: hypothetical protein VKM55_25075 [Candidatus Lokiarchaeia archaeon]|nr:hypothetical protein [Candidatus Lokiarchaeia archaeon]